MQIAVLSQELSGSLCCVRLIRITHHCVWCPIHLFLKPQRPLSFFYTEGHRDVCGLCVFLPLCALLLNKKQTINTIKNARDSETFGQIMHSQIKLPIFFQVPTIRYAFSQSQNHSCILHCPHFGFVWIFFQSLFQTIHGFIDVIEVKNISQPNFILA